MPVPKLFHVTYKRLFFSVNDFFLCKPENLTASINYCIQCSENTENALEEFHTLLLDLQQTEEQMWNSIYHRTRSEINSFLKNQDYTYTIDLNPSKALLKELVACFDDFARHKKIRRAEAFRLNGYLQNNILAVSYIKQNGNYICINFYRYTQARATNLYSFHTRHVLGDLYSKSHYGRAHKTLHWLDIQRFKQEQVNVYDFCGWYAGKENQAFLSINKFKEQFTQQKVKEYSGVIYRHPLLKLLKKLR